MTIIDQLRKAITRSGESQSAMAEVTGVDRAMLNQFIAGERGISFETAAKLCEHLRLVLEPR